jgi:hypothetical protein
MISSHRQVTTYNDTLFGTMVGLDPTYCRDVSQFWRHEMHFVFNGMGILAYFSYSLNKNYQNVNSKRLQLTTTVYFLTPNGHLTLFLNLTTDIDIHATDTPTTRDL